MEILFVALAGLLFGTLIACGLVRMAAGSDDDNASVEVRCERLKREAQDKQAQDVAKALARQAAFRGE